MDYLISQEDLDTVNELLERGWNRKAIIHLAEAVKEAPEVVPAIEPDPPEEGTSPSCMWKDCPNPGILSTPSGVKLCTFHHSQAVSSGNKIEVIL